MRTRHSGRLTPPRCIASKPAPSHPQHPWHPWAATDLPAQPGPRGPKDPCPGQPLIGTEQQARNSFGRAFGRKVLIDKLRRRSPCCRACNRPSRRTPEPRNELPPVHSITSSAIASTLGRIFRPSALAVLRFSTISYFTGNCTGRSPGFAPRRMPST